MPSTSYVSFNEGTARKVRTFQRTDGANTVEEWMYVESEPLFDTYTITATGVSMATANSHLLQIMAGASLRVGIKRIIIYQNASAAAAANSAIDIFRLTTAGTGGGSLTPAPTDPASAASGATSMTLPTAKGTETTNVGGRHRFSLSTVNADLGLNPLLDLRWGEERTKALWIAAGVSNGLAIKNPSASASTTVDIFVKLIEVGWV